MKNIKDIPTSWAVCHNDSCPMAADCLRYQMCGQLPAGVTRWMCVLPRALTDGRCSYYQKAEKVRMARGMSQLYDKVREVSVRKQIRLALTDHLGSKGTYYRYKDGERLITPALQQWIQDLFRRYGIEGKVTFDEYLEAYDFT